jgi:hypothetical protein
MVSFAFLNDWAGGRMPVLDFQLNTFHARLMGGIVQPDSQSTIDGFRP